VFIPFVNVIVDYLENTPIASKPPLCNYLYMASLCPNDVHGWGGQISTAMHQRLILLHHKRRKRTYYPLFFPLVEGTFDEGRNVPPDVGGKLRTHHCGIQSPFILLEVEIG
jgi:hypothetical protein